MTLREFLRQQRQSFEQLGPPPLRLCDDPVGDEQGFAQGARILRVDGGRADGRRDDVRCRQCEELIAQTALGAGLQVPAQSTAFEVGARALLTLARDLRRLHVMSSTTTLDGQTHWTTDVLSIDDVVPVALAWCDILITQAMTAAGESTSAEAPALLVANDATEFALVTPTDVSRIAPDSSPSSRSVARGECVFRCVHQRWEMVFEGTRAFAVVQLKGFPLIQMLLEHPNSPIDAITLMGTAAPSSSVEVEETAVGITRRLDGVPTSDDRTKRECHRKIAELTEDKEEALRRDDQVGADECQTKIDEIQKYLSASFNHRGLTRRTGSPLERARGAVRHQFRRALREIKKSHPDLGTHLQQAIRTGDMCVYETNDGIQWVTR